MQRIFHSYRSFFTKERARSLALAVLLLIISLIFQAWSSAYAIRTAGHFVGDIFLDNIPAIDVNSIIVEGAFFAILFSLTLVIVKPNYLIFALKAAALFITVRSFMIAATHLGIYPDQIKLGNGFFDRIYDTLNLPGGYFFSSHTGLPFLMALVFWNERVWRWIFILISILFGFSVLLAHVHYSIDVFAAPFMTYSIFKLTRYLFPEDYALIP